MSLEFRSIENSDRPRHKYVVTFNVDGRDKKVYFGDPNYEDFTQHGDKKRRSLYLKRHAKNEDWNNPLTPGALSRWILWGPDRNIYTNVGKFIYRFGLQPKFEGGYSEEPIAEPIEERPFPIASLQNMFGRDLNGFDVTFNAPNRQITLSKTITRYV